MMVNETVLSHLRPLPHSCKHLSQGITSRSCQTDRLHHHSIDHVMGSIHPVALFGPTLPANGARSTALEGTIPSSSATFSKMGDIALYGSFGYGSYSTVWLAVDAQITRFVALKIATARLSNSASANRELGIYRKLATGPPTPSSSTCFNGLLDHFQIHGPNGVHTAFVFEPLGPHLEQALRLTPAFNHGTMFAGSGESRPLPGIPAYQRLTKYLGRRALRNVLQGLQYLHAHGIVHGDLHFGNILATTREADLVCNAAKIAELQQRPEEGRPLERVDGKKDLWAPPYQLEPAGLLEYSSTKLDPYVKIADVGGSFHIDEPLTKISTPPELRSPETVLELPGLGTGIDIWSFGCLAFQIITGRRLFPPSSWLDADDAIRDVSLIQFSEILGPLPETMFNAWTRGSSYFAEDRKTRLPEMLDHGGKDGAFDFVLREGSDGGESEGEDAQDEKEGDGEEGDDEEGSDGEGVWGERDDNEDAASMMSFGPWSEPANASSKEWWVMMTHCNTLEQRLRKNRPEDIDEAEEQQILHLLRWVFQYEPAARPSAEEILTHPWFKNTGQGEGEGASTTI